jgi:excisionase family DNA binding protein
MSKSTEALLGPVRPSEDDVRVARSGRTKLQQAGSNAAVTLTLHEGKERTDIDVPEIVMRMLQAIMDEVAEGHAVALAPVDRQITTQKAADLLNVSRPHLVKLLEGGKIPFQKVGSHRRVRLADVLEYRARMEADAEKAYAELVAQGQALGMGYGD